MGELFLFLVVALTVAAIVFGVTVLISGGDPGLSPVEPDGRAVPLPGNRPLAEEDVARVRFDTALRGYRMAQVDQALRRAAYDIGYKGELIGVLEAEVTALREGRIADADILRRAREAAIQPSTTAEPPGAAAPATDGQVAAGPIAGAKPQPAAEPGAPVAVQAATPVSVAAGAAAVAGTAAAHAPEASPSAPAAEDQSAQPDATSEAAVEAERAEPGVAVEAAQPDGPVEGAQPAADAAVEAAPPAPDGSVAAAPEQDRGGQPVSDESGHTTPVPAAAGPQPESDVPGPVEQAAGGPRPTEADTADEATPERR